MIKMRSNTNEESCCCNCGEKAKEVLNMFDLCIGDQIFTICDRCNNQILFKSLKAECMKNGRTKSSRDMAVIRKRGQSDYEKRRKERIDEGRQRK